MGLEELCNQDIPSKEANTSISTTCTHNDIILESLYKELMQKKLLKLVKYINLNGYFGTININIQALIDDGYKININ